MFFSANTFPCQSYSICDLDGGFKDTLARLPPVFSLAMRSIRLQLLEPLCLWRFPGEFPGRAEHKGGESHVTAKLTSLLRSMRVCGEQMPGCRVVFESRLCYDLGTKVELVMVEDDETWARTLNHVMDQRHWKGIADADKQAATQDLQNFARGTLVSVLRRGIQPPRQ